MHIRSMIIGAAALMAAVPATAFGQVSLRPELSWGDDTDLGIGGRVVANVKSLEHWDFIGSFDVWFPDDSPNVDVSAWEANGNLAYNFLIQGANLFPYAGGGLNIYHISVDFDDLPGNDRDDTDLGVNLFGGVKFPASSVTPFAEVRVVLDGADQFALTGGILF